MDAEEAQTIGQRVRRIRKSRDKSLRGLAESLDLAVYLHVHVTRLWLAHAGAPADLLRRAVFLARRLAQERDEATTLWPPCWTAARVMRPLRWRPLRSWPSGSAQPA